MTAFDTANLHTDAGDKLTSARWDATNLRWVQDTEIVPSTVTGDIDDPAVSDPTADGSILARLASIAGALRVAAGSLLKAEDEAHATGDAGVLALAVRRDTAAVGSSADGDNSTLNVDSTGQLRTVSGGLPGYPEGATPIVVGSAVVAAAAATATMAAVAAETNYLAGFHLSGGGATAASLVTMTITGLLGGTRSFVVPIPAGVTTGIVPVDVSFDPPIPASAVNTAIVVSCPSFGTGNTDAVVNATGYVV